jgi:anti-anti-sigma factor
MNIETGRHRGWHRVTIKGELILKHLLKVRRILETLEADETPRIALDLTATAYVDSSAITMILNVHRKVRSRGGDLVISGYNAQIESVFSIVNIQEAMTVYADRAAFERALDTAGAP